MTANPLRGIGSASAANVAPKEIEIGPPLYGWQNAPRTELAGCDVLVRDEGRIATMYRLHPICTFDDGKVFIHYVALPKNRDDLTQVVRDLIEQNGLEL